MADVHEAIIQKGFRESGKKRGYIVYTRGDEEMWHKDYSPSNRWPHNPGAGVHLLMYFRAGRKLSGGTAWGSILARVSDVAADQD